MVLRTKLTTKSKVKRNPNSVLIKLLQFRIFVQKSKNLLFSKNRESFLTIWRTKLNQRKIDTDHCCPTNLKPSRYRSNCNFIRKYFHQILVAFLHCG